MYSDNRYKRNATILRDVGHSKERSHKGGIGQGRETKHINAVDVFSVQE
jgi:hypothetical protein